MISGLGCAIRVWGLYAIEGDGPVLCVTLIGVKLFKGRTRIL